MRRLGAVSTLLISMISQASATEDPILHSLDAPFPAHISTSGGTVTATYTLTNNLPFSFINPFHVTHLICPYPDPQCNASAAEFRFNDQCTGKKLQPREQCTYSISLTASTPGTKTVLVTYEGYDHNVVKINPALTTSASGSTTGGILGTVDFPLGHPLPKQTFTNTNYTVIFTFINYHTTPVSFKEQITQNGNLSHPNFTITNNGCIPSGTTGTLASGAQCSITGTFNYPSTGSVTLSAQLIGTISSNKPTTSTTVQSHSMSQLIGVDYQPNHYSSIYPFNFHDVFYTGMLNHPEATNVYAELQQLQNAGFTTVRSYQTEPYSWIDIINQAHALGMHVIYEAVIPQLPHDAHYSGCPLGPQNYISCAQETLDAVIKALPPNVFNSTVSLVFAGHENYCNQGNNTLPCTGNSNIPYLTDALDALKTTLAQNNLNTPVGSALVSGNLITPSDVNDMNTLISHYSSSAPLAFDPYPFQFGVLPATNAVWTPPLSSTVQLTNSLAWDYTHVVGSADPLATPPTPKQPFYTPGRVLLSAETGWATQGTTTGYACNSPGPCEPSLVNATRYFQTLYQNNTNNFVATSGYSMGVLAFEAYDEPEKTGPTAEKFYGLFDTNCVQKAAGMVPNNVLVSATGCQGYINGTIIPIFGSTPPNQPKFHVNITYPPSSPHPHIDVDIPPNPGTSLRVTPWPYFLIYQGAKITVSSANQSCSTTALTVTPAPSFSTVFCNNPPSSGSMGCSNIGCQLSNPY